MRDRDPCAGTAVGACEATERSTNCLSDSRLGATVRAQDWAPSVPWPPYVKAVTTLKLWTTFACL